jgi:hypothetical protein
VVAAWAACAGAKPVAVNTRPATANATRCGLFVMIPPLLLANPRRPATDLSARSAEGKAGEAIAAKIEKVSRNPPGFVRDLSAG